MVAIRPAAVAGFFYTRDAAALRDEVNAHIAAAPRAGGVPKALIAPHAGYMYSGAIAGSAYACLAAGDHAVRRVVLLGPAHRVYVRGVAASGATAFNTPLGPVPIDTETVNAAVDRFDFITVNDAAHADEHSLEVQLPFLQSILERFLILPFAVGNADPSEVERLLDFLWGREDTLIVISSDLSHYLDYATARNTDAKTTAMIQRLEHSRLSTDNACGQIPICGLLRCAARRNMRCEVIDVRNSGDTAGGKDRVVGYGAYAFYAD